MRILIASESAPDAERASALVTECSLEDVVIRIHVCETEPVPERGSYDLLLVSGAVTSEQARHVIECSGAADQRVPLLFLTTELTAPVATLANRTGARVCLFEHGPGPLREAIIRDNQRFAAQRERERELREEVHESGRASERVRALVNVSVSDVVFRLHVEGERFRFLEINPAFTKSTGLTEEQVVGRLVDEVIPEPSLSLVQWKYREALSQRRTVQWDEVTEYPTGKRYGHVSVTPIVELDGNCATLIGTVHDVTDERVRSETLRQYANVADAVQIGLTMWTLDEATGALTLHAANPAAERISGVPVRERLGERLTELFPHLVGSGLIELLQDVGRSGEMGELNELQAIRDPRRYFSFKAFPLSTGKVGLAFEDVSTQTRARMLVAAEKRILEMVGKGDPLERNLTELCLDIERLTPPALASILLLSPDGKHVVQGAAPNLPDPYNRAIDSLPIGPTAGSCGTAAALKRPVIVTDIEIDPLWDAYRDLAREHGLRACWSTPILAVDGRVLGTFALYYREPRAPDETDLELIDRATHVAGIAIARHEIEHQLRELSTRIEAAREEERTGIARELHDQLGQSLTALKFELAWISRRTGNGNGGSDEVREKVKETMHLTDDLIQQLRRISAELRPALLDDLGLVSALRWQASEFARRTHVEVTVNSNVDDERVSREVSTAVFRVFQEALTNVARHASAHHVEVRLETRAGAVVLEVRDDGRGIGSDDVQSPWSLGLLGIRERARRVDGTVAFGAVEPHGTVVTLRLPVGKMLPPRGPSGRSEARAP